MTDKISVTINNRAHLKLLQLNFEYIKTQASITDVENLNAALDELLENILFHAYKNLQKINLHVNFILTTQHITIEVQEHGIPFDFHPYLYESINHKDNHTKGFYHIYDLVEYFTFSRQKDGSKYFVLTQSLLHPYNPISQQQVIHNLNRSNVLEHLKVSTFHEDDAQGITQLIYKNYDYTYYKARYYNPQEVLKDNATNKIISIVCKDRSKVVGHFAIIRSEDSNIAEIAIAIVDPLYKRLGIMNLMFNTLIEVAKEHSFSALYGEGMMIHPYSQKANLRHKMVESAIILGEVPSRMEIEHSIKDSERSGVVIAFLLFNPHQRRLNLPTIYKNEILKVYSRAHIKILSHTQSTATNDNLHVEKNELLNVAIIIIKGTFNKHSFLEHLNQLLSQQYDMIFADISLEDSHDINSIVSLLNNYNFFYSGILFHFYAQKDHLRLQRKNSTAVDEEHLICYSEDAKELLKFIQNDKSRVMKSI